MRNRVLLWHGRVPSRATKRAHHRYLLGCAIRRRREALGLSQEGLAEVADVHRNFVGYVERGEQNVSIDSMVRFAAALKTNLAALCADAGI